MTRPLHVGLVCPYSIAVPGGVQNHVLGLAGWLHSAGHRVSVLAPDSAPAGMWHRHGLPPSVFTTAGRSVPVPYNGSVARINFGPRTGTRVRRWLDTADLDVLHLHEPVTPSASILALWRTRHHRHRALPVVATFHTATPRSRTMRLTRPVLRRSIDRIGARVAVSATAADVVRTHLRRDTVVVANGIEHGCLAPPPQPPRRTPRRLVFLGRLDEPRKGLDVLLRAWPRIRGAHPDAELLLAGAGRRRHLPAGCRALGLVDDDTRAELLASTDLFVAPHRGRESFGLVVAEAMAAGAVVVAADIPAFVDVLTGPYGERYGQLFTAGDPGALADAVLGVLTDPTADPGHRRLREQASRAARQYDWSAVAPQVLDIYRATLAEQVAPRRQLVR